jgi:hypothetical protein
MTGKAVNPQGRFVRFLCLLLLSAAASACAGVDVVHFTSDVYPAKRSGADVKLLDEKPDQPHVRIAQITIADSKKKNATLQRLIRDKAAELGADAILFSDPEHYYDHSVRYAPAYQPWGYYAPYSGWYGGTYMAGVPVSHKTRRNSLSGVAIKFTGSSG